MDTNRVKCLSFSFGAIERKTERRSPQLARRRFQWRSKNKRDHRVEARRSHRLRRGIASVYACTHVREAYRSARPRQSISRGIPDVRPECRDSRSAGTPSTVDHTSQAISLSLSSISHPFAGQETPERRLLCWSRYISISTCGTNNKRYNGRKRQRKGKETDRAKSWLSTELNEGWNISKWTKYSDILIVVINISEF